MSIVSEAFRLLDEESKLARAEVRMCVTKKTLRRRRGKPSWKVIAAGNILEMEERFRSIASAFMTGSRRVRGQYRLEMTHPGYKCWYVVSVYVKITRPGAAGSGGSPGVVDGTVSLEDVLNKVV